VGKQTRVAFVIDRIGLIETYSIPLLSAMAKHRGHPVILVEYDRDPQAAIRKLRDFKPQVLAYSVMSPDATKYLKINRRLKAETGAYSIFGGVHPTFFQDYILEDGVDAICVGEGDYSFGDFLDTFGTSAMYDTANMHFRQGNEVKKNPLARLVQNLDELPFPDKDIIYDNSYFIRNLPIRGFFTTRGCPYKCTYCFNHAFNEMYRGNGQVVRMKSVDYALAELKRTIERHPTSFLKFHDDVFGVKKDWLAEFADRYPKEIGLPFLVLARPNMVTDAYCKELKRAGCHSVTIAIESGNDGIRNTVMQRKMSEELIVNAFENLHRYGFRINSLNMIGLPTETEETALETIRLNQRLKSDFADASIFQPYPGVSITKFAVDNGWVEDGITHWGGQYSRSVLNFPEELKARFHAYQVVFPLLVEFPRLMKLFPLILWLNETSLGSTLLGLIYRFSYGFMMTRRLYPVRIPFRLRIAAMVTLLMSKHRN